MATPYHSSSTSNDTTKAEHPVFFDPSRKRAAHLGRVAGLLGIVVLVMLTVFWASVAVVPIAQQLRLRAPKFIPDNAIRGAASLDASRHPAVTGRHLNLKPVAPGYAVPGRASGVVGGFYVSWDEVSLASLRDHAQDLTHFFPGWMHVAADGDRVTFDDSDPADIAALKIARDHHLSIVPLLNNFDVKTNDFEEGRLHRLLSNPTNRAHVAGQIADYLTRHSYQGINVDLETENESDRALLAVFAQELSQVLRPRGLLLTEDVQTGNLEETASIARYCDFVVPMIYDLHWATGDAGPIAPEKWAEDQLSQVLSVVPREKIALAIGNYAYNWERGKPNAQTLTFGEAMATARESQSGDDGVVRMDKASNNPTFTYEEDGKRHDVWFLDATTAYNFLRYAESRGVSGHALWYVGSEDPSLWTFFGRGRKLAGTSELNTVRYGWEIDFEGEGEILDVAAAPQEGHRTLTVASDGKIVGEHFTSYPSVYIVRRSGLPKVAGRRPRTLALTFDDGPDPEWTPQILDVLKSAQVPATFFVIGENAEARPDLLAREWDEGHEIGNHSFYHPNLSEVPAVRARLEIDATQRAIESATGRATPLFRPPYGIDVEPSTASEMLPVVEAERLGYVTVGEGIDPRDWDMAHGKPSPETIADNIVSDAVKGEWNVVLLHDGGGDRAATVAALPIAIRKLRAMGYTFTTVSALMHQGTREQLFPRVTGWQRLVLWIDRNVFWLSTTTGRAVVATFLFTLIAGTLRLGIVTGLALVHRRREQAREEQEIIPTLLPSVSVVIAAYNEEKVITRTIEALLAGGYPKLEVIVVDDGSKDNTAQVVAQKFGDNLQVRLIVKTNGGKASALNMGIAQASGEVLVGLDADTLFAPDTVHRLARHFADPGVGAVAGNIAVGNRVNLLTRWQSVEYITSQNFDRRAYDVLNAIPVVPGCVSAWRMEAVRAAGGYAVDTLAEDADLTFRVRRQGWRILSDSSARAYTEAPEHLRDLAKQRFRWTFGTLQTLWKHRDVAFHARWGWFGMFVIPSMWVFQVLLPLALPFADLGLLWAALAGRTEAALLYFAFFFAAELAAAFLAFALDGDARSKRADLSLLIMQRVVYRYLLFWVLVRALGFAMRGTRAGWNKLERRGTARVSH